MIIITILVPLMVLFSILGMTQSTTTSFSCIGFVNTTIYLMVCFGVQAYLSWCRPLSNPVAIYLIIMGILQIFVSFIPELDSGPVGLKGSHVRPVDRPRN